MLTSANKMNGKIFFRQISSGTTWTAWSNFYTTAYKPTTAEIGAARAYSASYSFGGSQTGITTAQFIDLLESLGAFDQPYWIARGSWRYAGNKYITDTGFGNVHLAGTVVEVIGNTTSYTIRLTLPTTSGLTSLLGCELVYINNGDTYKPGWRKVYSSLNKPTPSEIGALPLSGGTMTGSLKLKGDPTESLEAATKAYVDRQIGESGSGDMRKAVYDTDNDGVVDKAEKLGAARTIGLGGAVASTATSFDGSQNITIPVTLVRESYLSWGGKSLAGSITPVDSALADFASGNRLFGTPASSISIEVSRNGGSTWSAYPGVTDGGKRTLVSTGTSYNLGGVGSGNTVQDQLRVTISAGSFYFFCRKVLMNVSTNGATGMKVNIKYSTIGAPDTFKDYGTFSLSGWSGWNSIPLSMSWGGGSNQTGQTKKVQFTFTMTGAGPAAVYAIYAYGENAWAFPNVMAKYGRSYDVDYDCNSTFRGKVTLKQDPSSNLEAATKQYVDKGAISTYTHSKSGTVHTLTGSGDNIRFIATADFTSGDTFKIGATTVTAKTIGGDSLWTGFFKKGAVVTCYKNGTTINFNGGGLPASELAKLTPENIKSGIKITANGKTVTGTFTNDGTATQDDILLGKTAYVAGVKLTGRIPKAPSSTPATGSGNSGGQFYLTTQEGFYAEGTKLTKPSEEMGSAIGLTAGVLKTGTTVGGVRGTYTSDANAGSRDLRSGKTAYVNGTKISGGLVDLGYEPEGSSCGMYQNRLYSYFGDSSSSYIIARAVNIPQSKVASAIGLTAAKIAKGNTILGIAGTYAGASGGYLYMGQRNNTQMYGYAFGTATYSNGVRIGTSGNYRLIMFGYNETGYTIRMKVNGGDIFSQNSNPSAKAETTRWLNAGDTVTISADSGVNYALTGFVISV